MASSNIRILRAHQAIFCLPLIMVFYRGICVFMIRSGTKTHKERRDETLVGIRNTKVPLQQVYLQNYTMKPYPYITNCSIDAVEFAPTWRRILLALSTRNILSYDLDKYNKTILEQKAGVKSIAVDEDRQLVFLSTSSPKKGVGVMKTEGRNFTYIYRVFVRSISVDSKRERLFLWVCQDKRIIMMAYDGNNITDLYKTKTCFGGMTFDYDKNQLYVHDGTSLMVISSPNQTTNVTTLTAALGRSLYYHGGSIFAVLREDIVTLELGKKNVIPQTNLKVKGLYFVVGVC